MQSIWKYALHIEDEQSFVVPEGAVPLSVQMQDGGPCLWMLVDTSAKKVSTRVLMFGTGQPVQEHGAFVGTVQFHGGRLVLHVFMGK